MAVMPVVAELTRTPSTSTRTWSASEPRMRIAVCAPRPPVWAISTPDSMRSRPGRSRAVDASMSPRVMTLVCCKGDARLCAILVGVTTMVSPTNVGRSSAWAETMKAAPKASPRTV